MFKTMCVIRNKIATSCGVFVLIMSFVFSIFSCASTQEKVDLSITPTHERVFYEIFVASFFDSDGNGVGDLNGVTKNLDYVSDYLGAKGIWLMPIMKSPTYHKYDVTDYYAVDKSFGTTEDFRALAQACDEKDIILIIDLPLNHSSSQHSWFYQACSGVEPYASWYNFSDTFKSGYHQVSSGFTSLAESLGNKVPGKYYEGHFTSSMPDLNLDDPLLREEILKICKYWMDLGVDGFRLDAVLWFYNSNNNLNNEFLNWLTYELKKINPDVYMVGEGWADGSSILKLHESDLTTFFNFTFAQSTGKIISSIRSGKGEALAVDFQKWYDSLPENSIDSLFLANHDMPRSSGALLGKLELQKQAASVYLLMPGSPYVYYGEEIGMQGGSGKDENKRTSFVWSVENFEGTTKSPAGADDIRKISAGVVQQKKDKNSLLAFYKKVISIRNQYPVIATGKYNVIKTGNAEIMAYEMSANPEYSEVSLSTLDSVYIFQNISDKTVEIDLSTEELLFLQEKSVLANLAASGDKPSKKGSVLLMPAYSTLLLGNK